MPRRWTSSCLVWSKSGAIFSESEAMPSTDHAAAIPLQPIPAHTRIVSWFSPTVLVSLGIAILLVFLIANPLWQLVSESLRDPDTSTFSLVNHAKAFGRERFIQAYTNT